jgi:hypothetical protein
MLSSLYIFFCAVDLVLLFLALYDWGATKQRVAGFPALCSVVMSLILFSVSWRVTAVSNGTEISALAGWESYALAAWWFLMAMVSVIMSLVIFLESPKELGV